MVFNATFNNISVIQMFVVSFFVFDYTPASKYIWYWVTSSLIFSTESLGINTQYMPRALVRLANLFNCLAYDWTIESKMNERLHDMIGMLLDDSKYCLMIDVVLLYHLVCFRLHISYC